MFPFDDVIMDFLLVTFRSIHLGEFHNVCPSHFLYNEFENYTFKITATSKHLSVDLYILAPISCVNINMHVILITVQFICSAWLDAGEWIGLAVLILLVAVTGTTVEPAVTSDHCNK